MKQPLPHFPGSSASSQNHRFSVKDPGSALTHLIGFLAGIFLTPLILLHASARGAAFSDLIGLGIFMISLILLYGASTTYHTFAISRRQILKKLDHMMIFVLIAGSYTPICLSILPQQSGRPLLIVIWSIAFLGMLFKLFFVHCPKWISSVLYIGMGWACIFVIPRLFIILPTTGFLLLFLGGLAYTAGGVLYAQKLTAWNMRHPFFGSHEIFHVFVLAGSLCHYLLMYHYIV